jgi:hypothetical protein
VLVFFSALWSSSSRSLRPLLGTQRLPGCLLKADRLQVSPDRSATAFQTRGVMVVCVEVDQEAELTANQNIRSVPTLSMFKNEQNVA